MADVYGLLGRIGGGSSWTDGTGTTTLKDRLGRVTSITRVGRPVATNKYGERVSPFTLKAQAGSLPVKEYGR